MSIKKNGRHVANSPITIMVVQSEIGDASRVKVFGQGLVEGHTFEMADFVVDTREAGEKTPVYLVFIYLITVIINLSSFILISIYIYHH